MKTSVYIATSIDGFIAGPDGDISSLPTTTPPADGDMGYNDFISTVDAIVLGRKSFEKVLTFPEFPYKNLKAVVVVTNCKGYTIPKDIGSNIYLETSPDNPHMLLENLEARLNEKGSANTRADIHAYIDGGITIKWFLSFDRIDEMTITHVPVLLGKGIPLFGDNWGNKMINFKHQMTKSYQCGLVQTMYSKC